MSANGNSGGPMARPGPATAAPQPPGITCAPAKLPASRSRFAAPPQTRGSKPALRISRKLQNANRSLPATVSQSAGRGQVSASLRIQDASETRRVRMPGKMLIFTGQGDHDIWARCS
jgi:hypothetical protein